MGHRACSRTEILTDESTAAKRRVLKCIVIRLVPASWYLAKTYHCVIELLSTLLFTDIFAFSTRILVAPRISNALMVTIGARKTIPMPSPPRPHIQPLRKMVGMGIARLTHLHPLIKTRPASLVDLTS